MSLNGLEATEVNDAYQAAQGEGGGWFLLKYISRDEVGLLGKGNGGLTEVEEVVTRYEEQSPLYGFIQYRRRKVILKYIPEGTSRLLQARVTVQFQSVIEKLSPHDTVYSFTKSADLRDSALSSACSLHTATASIKSSNDSLPQKGGLAEITEDMSETRTDTVGRLVYGDTITRDEEQPAFTDDRQPRPEKVDGFASADGTHHRSPSATTQNSFRPRTTSNTDKPLPPPPTDDYTHENTSTGLTLDYGDNNTRPSMDGRFSSNSTRPSTRDLYDAYGYKKKAKVGPRPSTDSIGATNDSSLRTNEFRPVSTLPAGLRMPSRKNVPARPTSRQAQASPSNQTSSSISPVKPNPPAQANSSEKITPQKAPTTSVAPIHISGRNNSLPNSGPRTTRISEPGSPKMTPEKQRLMKALQLRQKQIAAQNIVNGPGIQNLSEEPEFSRPEVDDSILGAVMDASGAKEGPEPIVIATQGVVKEGSRLLEDSPTSMPETAEGPSTQASSITDDEEAVAQKRQENQPTSIPSVQEHQDMSDQLHETTPSDFTGGQDIILEDSEKDMLTVAAVIESPKDSSGPSAPMRSEPFAVGKDIAERKAVGKDSPGSGRHGDSLVIETPISNAENIATSERVGGDKQLSPSQPSGSQATESPPPIAGDAPSSADRRTTSATLLNEKTDKQQSEPLGSYEQAGSTGEALKDEQFPQTQSLEHEDRAYNNANTDFRAGVLHSQPGQCPMQSFEHPVQESDEAAPREGPNDPVKPLLVRRSSSSKSTTVHDSINAHEIPLPPIDEDEEISLSPQRALFQEQAASRLPLDNDGELQTATPEAKILSHFNDHMVTGNLISNGVDERQTERHSQSQGVVNPIKRVSSPDQSDEHFLSDDSFMEELKSATVQEAKPVSVSKSPIKPVFSRSESEQKLNGSVTTPRSVSSPVNHSAKNGETISSLRPPTPLSTPRSISAQHAPRSDSQPTHIPISKKIGVSSSISQRIKALEQLSSRPTSPVSPKLAPNTSPFLGLRTTSLRTPSDGSDYKKSSIYKNRSDLVYPSPSPSPELINSSLINSHDVEHARPTRKPTVTIVHHAREESPGISPHPPEPRHLELQEKALVSELQKSPPPVEHQPMGPPPLSPLKPPRPRFGRYSSTRSGSSSSNEPKLEPPPATRRDSFASIRSKSSRAGSEVELPHTLRDSSPSGLTSLDGTQEEKKDSRRSRLLKRMSSISSMSRRSIAHALSPAPKEAPIIERQEPAQEVPSNSVDIGDVNVQFPDNLLWKRRHMIIDAQGMLVLSASKSDNNSKVITKRYPLSDFHLPYIPDQDRQELPNSVVLDFKDGSTLQCACEHFQGQAGVLKALRHAHSTHQSQ